MKTININVQFTFDEKITSDNEIKEVVTNTMSALVDNGFISPADNENVSLVQIELKEHFTNTNLIERI